LRQKAGKVVIVDSKVQTLLDDMADTLKSVGGLGLAAPQVGAAQRLFVVNTGNDMIKFVNPVIIKSEGEQVSFEACLSLPGVYAKVKRPERVVVRALDEHAKPFELDAIGQLACTLSHEADHLDGILFTDRTTQIRRLRTGPKPDTGRPSG
jgi:peptide deformylase